MTNKLLEMKHMEIDFIGVNCEIVKGVFEYNIQQNRAAKSLDGLESFECLQDKFQLFPGQLFSIQTIKFIKCLVSCPYLTSAN